MAVIKCSISSLDYDHIYSYFALDVLKQRVFEAVCIKVPETGEQVGKKTLEGLFKLQKMKYIDEDSGGGNLKSYYDAVKGMNMTDQLKDDTSKVFGQNSGAL